MSPEGQHRRRLWPLAFAVLELLALAAVADVIGFGWALLLALSTSVAGLALLRAEGFRAWGALRRAAAGGQLVDQTLEAGERDGQRGRENPDEAGPATRMADAGVRILRAVLLILPGFITDALALTLLIPPVRRSVGRRLSASVFRTFSVPAPPRSARSAGSPSGPQHGVVIEGEVVDADADQRRFGRRH